MSQFLSIKSRVPFVRQPSNESLAETGHGNAMSMRPLLSRPASIMSTDTTLRPMSLGSNHPLTTGSDAGSTAGTGAENPYRRAAENLMLNAAERGGDVYRAAKPVFQAWAVPVTLTGLTIWCVTLTVYVARSNEEIDKLWDFPACEDLGLTHFSQAPGLTSNS